jgi:hypothetical protein
MLGWVREAITVLLSEGRAWRPRRRVMVGEAPDSSSVMRAGGSGVGGVDRLAAQQRWTEGSAAGMGRWPGSDWVHEMHNAAATANAGSRCCPSLICSRYMARRSGERLTPKTRRESWVCWCRCGLSCRTTGLLATRNYLDLVGLSEARSCSPPGSVGQSGAWPTSHLPARPPDHAYTGDAQPCSW